MYLHKIKFENKKYVIRRKVIVTMKRAEKGANFVKRVYGLVSFGGESLKLFIRVAMEFLCL